MTAIALAIALTLSPVGQAITSAYAPASAWSVTPKTIRVLRIHHKGSSVPKRIEVWPLERYDAAVMASGAWPNRVWESAKVGALAINQYSRWMIVHHQPGYSWRGHRYDISDSDQYLRADIRPWSHLPARTLAAVRIMKDVLVRKNGRYFRTGWSGGRCLDGWHACEDTVRALAQRGWGWRRIVHRIFYPVRIVEG